MTYTSAFSFQLYFLFLFLHHRFFKKRFEETYCCSPEIQPASSVNSLEELKLAKEKEAHEKEIQEKEKLPPLSMKQV